MDRIVIALGGNALGKTPDEQLKLAAEAAISIADVVESGSEVIIVHGNGPQVGMINLAMEIASDTDEKVPKVPYPECGAMSQGYIGYHLQQLIGEELKRRKINKSVAAIITQVVVDKSDPAFKNPEKPVGLFYTKEEAESIAKKTGEVFGPDAGRGFRRLVPSPEPVEIIEIDIIKKIVDSGNIIIAAGGGGIPVVRESCGLKGVAAVIDKDKSAARLAADLKADKLIILTAVEKVCINFGKPDEKPLDCLSLDEARSYINDGQFARGSMLPKVEACIEFIKEHPEGEAVISSLEMASAAINKTTGTVFRV